jgi:hypothetical protein
MSQGSRDGASDLREDPLEMLCGAIYFLTLPSSQWVSATNTLIFLPFHLILAKRMSHVASFTL